MRPERLFLQDIVEAADAVQRFIGNVSKEQFISDELRQSAILQKLLVIGEAAARLPLSFRRRNPDIPWSDVVEFRNFAIHAYFSCRLVDRLDNRQPRRASTTPAAR